ncbi:MAG: Cephalosporin-C deacetylase [Turneriella sp.]|nr:Cephalosporin-C deacetylase [Turneriella sp.]
MALFDDCFNSEANIALRPKNLEKFWKEQIQNLKKIPIEMETKKKVSRKILTEQNLTIEFQSIDKYHMQAQLFVPRKLSGKSPLVLIFPDYAKEAVIYKGLMNAGIAQMIVRMRGHEAPRPIEEKKDLINATQKTEKHSSAYGYFAERLLEIENYYAGKIFLDAYRALEVARLRREVDTSRIGIIGQGVGAAQALFASAFMERGDALYLENPAFLNLDETQNMSDADYAREINTGARGSKKVKQQIKENLRYFDPVYFAEKIKTDCAFSINLHNKESSPHGAFALFHLLQCEKDMFLFTENDPLSLAREKKEAVTNVVKYFREKLLGQKME